LAPSLERSEAEDFEELIVVSTKKNQTTYSILLTPKNIETTSLKKLRSVFSFHYEV